MFPWNGLSYLDKVSEQRLHNSVGWLTAVAFLDGRHGVAARLSIESEERTPSNLPENHCGLGVISP